jgi:hypothetical protein
MYPGKVRQWSAVDAKTGRERNLTEGRGPIWPDKIATEVLILLMRVELAWEYPESRPQISENGLMLRSGREIGTQEDLRYQEPPGRGERVLAPVDDSAYLLTMIIERPLQDKEATCGGAIG